MKWKQFLRDYLNFSRKDRIAAGMLIGLMVVIYALPYLLQDRLAPAPPVPNDVLQAALDTLEERKNEGESRFREEGRPGRNGNTSVVDFRNRKPFAFDPNTLAEEGWQALGLSQRTARTIRNYVGKGGRFYKPEDLRKIWGLPAGFYEHVGAFIRIEGQRQEYRAAFREPLKKETVNGNSRAIANINAADTSAWIALPGIGSKLAARILNFREKLGGFHSVEQVGETYGLPDSTFQRIKPLLQVQNEGIRKLSINTASKEQLGAHPYIRWKLGNAIVEYRNRHGPYTDLEELKKIELVDEATFQKVRHYVEL